MSPVTTLTGIVPLALLDAVSVATLAVPIWFLLGGADVRYRLVTLYLAIVAVAYTGVGVTLLAVLPWAERVSGLIGRLPGLDRVQFGVGVVIMTFAAWYGLVHRTRANRSGLLQRWRHRAVGGGGRPAGVLVVALAAVLAEVPTMLPYLSAIRRVADSGLSHGAQLAVLAAYAAIMTAPALLLTVSSVVLRSRTQSALHVVDDWLRRNAQENTAWLLAILGFLVASSTTLYQRFTQPWGTP